MCIFNLNFVVVVVSVLTSPEDGTYTACFLEKSDSFPKFVLDEISVCVLCTCIVVLTAPRSPR